MWPRPESDQYAEELYLAGEWVPAGTYRQIGSGRELRLDGDDALPASLDGRVACYCRVHRWDEMMARQTAHGWEATLR